MFQKHNDLNADRVKTIASQRLIWYESFKLFNALFRDSINMKLHAGLIRRWITVYCFAYVKYKASLM